MTTSPDPTPEPTRKPPIEPLETEIPHISDADEASNDGPDQPGGKPTLAEKLAIAAADIKIAHSVFALPFAALAAFLAGPGRWVADTAESGADESTQPIETATEAGGAPGWGGFAFKLLLIILCMVFARSWAMLVNRLADRKLDAENPRTTKRAFAAGTLSASDGLLMLAGSAGLFIGVCALFLLFFDNDWPLYGSVPVLLWIAFYSFTKRFTLLCHFFLGGALAVSPIAAAVAVDPASIAMPSIWLLAGMVLCWVAGFDVIYALQDHEHDSEAGLHSIPAKLGPKRAIALSRVLHVVCFAILCGAWVMNPNLLHAFGVGVGLTGLLLITEHLILAKRGEAGLNMAFFTVNGVISLILGGTGIFDIFL